MPLFERLMSIFWTTPDHFPVKDMCIHVHIYIYIDKFDHDLTVLPNPGIMANKGNHPQRAARFRLVKYYNLPSIMPFSRVIFSDSSSDKYLENSS